MSGSLSKSIGLSSTTSKFVEQETTPASATSDGGGKQGIVVAILSSEEESCKRRRAGAGASLRRTLSADMSSKRWLVQNGVISPMKKIASSEELISVPAPVDSFSASEEEEQEEDCEEVNTKEDQGRGEFDIWSLMISQKAKEDSKSVSPPYIHPLVMKRSASLSENSLKICTESLGSETGSDGFSSYPSSENGDNSEGENESQEEDEKSQLEQTIFDRELNDHHPCCQPVKFNYSAGRKSAPRSLPPPLHSLSGGRESRVRIQTRRDNGRLVVEAVSIPPRKNYFAAQRRGGRLVLTFAKGSANDVDVTADPSIEEQLQKKVKTDSREKKEDEEFEEEFVNFEDENEGQLEEEEENHDEEEDEEEVDEELIEKENNIGVRKINVVIKKSPKAPATRFLNVHRLAIMMNKPIGLANRSPAIAWPNKFNEAVQLDELDQDQEKPIVPSAVAQSLPPRPRPAIGRLIPSPPSSVTKGSATSAAATTASFNAYEYFWRRGKPVAVSAGGLKNSSNYNNKLIMPSENQTPNDHHQQQQLLVMRGNRGENLVPVLKGCKEPRRTLCWEPYCITTSS